MLFEKSPISLILIICLITIYSLFNIKENVMSLRSELKEVNNQLQYEIDTIHLLKAELAYLTSPERLKELNNSYIKLSETKVSQMDVDPLARTENTYVRKIAGIKNKNVKWRYKKGPSKYVTVSAKK